MILREKPHTQSIKNNNLLVVNSITKGIINSENSG